MASHKGLRTGLDPFERFKPLFLVTVNIQRGQNHKPYFKGRVQPFSTKKKKAGGIRLSKWKVWTQGMTPPFSSGYSLALMLGINNNSSPPVQGGKQARSGSVVSKLFCLL